MSSVKAFNAAIGYTIGNYLIKGLTFFTIPIFTRLLSPHDFGMYNIFIASESFLYLFIGFTIHASYKSAWYKFDIDDKAISEGMDFHTYVSTSMTLILASTLVWTVIVLLFSDYLSSLLMLDKACLILLVFYSAAMATLACYNARVGIQFKYKYFLIISGINAVANIGLSILLICTVFNCNRSFGRIVGTTMPAVILSAGIMFATFRKAKPHNFKPLLGWGVRYSLPIIPNGIGQMLLSQFDRLMINKMISPMAAGLYSFGYNIFGLVNVTFLSLDNAFSPWVFQKMNANDYKAIKSKSNVYVIMMFLLSSFVIIISPELVNILGTSEYSESVFSVIPIVAGGYFLFLSSLPICVEYYYEKTRMIATATALAAIVKIVLNLYFIPRFGYVSAAYTTVLTYALYFALHYYSAIKIHGSELFSLRTISSCSVILMAVCAISIVTIDLSFMRWLCAIIIGFGFVVYEEKKIGFAKKIKSKFLYKTKNV